VPTNWKVPTVDDAQTLLSSIIVGAANELDSGGTERLEKILTIVVDEVRGAILAAGVVPLSITDGSVPSEGVRPTLMLAVGDLVNSTPQLQQFTQSDWLNQGLKSARDWLESVKKGQSVTIPTDPDPDFELNPDWGDFSGLQVDGVAGKVDMTTDGL
jgi:hypothetical protein